MTMTKIERERLQAILEFWHRVEFFIPFDVSSRAEEREGRVTFWLHAATLEDDTAKARRPIIPEEKEVAGFTIFFGIFDKSELTEITTKLCRNSEALDPYEDNERSDMEGDTCFASLDLDAAGQPVFDRFSVSTLPWAMGHASKGNLATLSAGAFADSKRYLSELLANFREQRRIYSDDDNVAHALNATEISDFNKLLQEWAGFKPRGDRPVALVEVRLREKRKEKIALQHLSSEGADSNLTESEDDEDSDTDQEIGILNSFYLEDLERALASLQRGSIPETLRQYLTPLSPESRIDLYTDAGHRAIFDILHPRNLNRGRWPAEAHHAMSLMQQFAINATAHIPESGGLFSVNGPPGTGKTTLLREIIADNIVKRARVLSTLPNPRKAFRGKTESISFEHGEPAFISTLIPELIGFEMVVASSNNAAVENISRDLPKRSSVAEASEVEYLQTVAHKIAAQTPKGSFTKLKKDDVPWGLISCTLGKANNRRQFSDRFSFKAESDKRGKSRAAEGTFETIWEWLKTYQGPSFSEAAHEFKEHDAKLNAQLELYFRLADLFAEVGATSLGDFCRGTLDAIRDAEEQGRKAAHARNDTAKQIRDLEQQLAALKEKETLLDRTAPAWWHAIWPTRIGRNYRAAKSENAHQQIATNEHMAHLHHVMKRSDLVFAHASKQIDQCKLRHAERLKSWHSKTEELAQMAKTLGNPAMPSMSSDLEKDDFQIKGLWHSDNLADQRTKLFESALRLQAAWLAEVGKSKGGFGGNIVAINKLLNGNFPVNRSMVPVLWQSLFMIVPVVSTTFASFARQFQGLDIGDLGWLFIDEAGQAVPQAAVGALLRARNGIVIGDPLQIEPVFTLSSKFIHALAALSPHTDKGDYAPTRVSVQSLADQSNRFGTAVVREGEADLWIGSPLRVHRRCVDPMFSLSNTIAYDEKMVFGLPARTSSSGVSPNFGDSAWIDVKGNVSGKQTVQEQIDFMVETLIESYQRDGELPLIYIITPFKEIKNKLSQSIRRAVWVGPDGYPTEPPQKIKSWLKERVGTVHTFQGKEENAVFMILGTDTTHSGATKWASSKPNLLNVAATRARHRFFIVGDHDLWRAYPYFNTAAQMLKPISRMVFIDRIRSDHLSLPTQ